MPKTTKRAATKKAAKIAKAHVTDLPPQLKAPPLRRAPREKRRVRGLGRYPWAITLIVLLLAGGIFSAYRYQIGPFAPRPKVVATPKPVATSPCIASSVVKQLTDTAKPLTTAEFDKIQHKYSKAPSTSIDSSKLYCVGLNTSKGLIVLELDPKIAPNTVNNFVFLAQHNFYDGLKFHRVLPKQIIQTGSPDGTGTGTPGYKFNDEKVQGSYTQGCVAMANSGANTNGSQFFICTGDETSLPKSYNLFGHVVQGMDIALKIQGPGDDASTKNIKPDTMNYVKVLAVNP